VYDQEAVLPIKINLQICRVYKQETLLAEEMDAIDEVPEGRLRVLPEIKKERIKVAKAYNKRVKIRSF
jgi:hypothetical protein